MQRSEVRNDHIPGRRSAAIQAMERGILAAAHQAAERGGDLRRRGSGGRLHQQRPEPGGQLLATGGSAGWRELHLRRSTRSHGGERARGRGVALRIRIVAEFGERRPAGADGAEDGGRRAGVGGSRLKQFLWLPLSTACYAWRALGTEPWKGAVYTGIR